MKINNKSNCDNNEENGINIGINKYQWKWISVLINISLPASAIWSATPLNPPSSFEYFPHTSLHVVVIKWPTPSLKNRKKRKMIEERWKTDDRFLIKRLKKNERW